MGLLEALYKVSWPSYLFIVISVPSLPIYIFVVIVILRKRRKNCRFRTTYYNLVIAQGIADITAMSLYLTTYIPRAFQIGYDFYWNNRDFIAPFSFNHSMFFLIVRCYEDALMSLQRYFTVSRRTANPHALQKLGLPAILVISWLPPSLIAIPIIIHWPQTFDMNLNMLTPAEHQKFCDIYQIIFQLGTFSISNLAYFSVLRTIVRSRSTKTLTREMRLSLVAMGQVIGFLLVIIYHIAQYLVVHYNITEAIRDIRTYFPLITGFESYINPWLHLILNTDLRYEIIYLWRNEPNQIRNSTFRGCENRGNTVLKCNSKEVYSDRRQPSVTN